MAYTLKTGKTVINPWDGSTNQNAYAIIDDVGINKQRKQIRFDLNIYFNRAARVSNLPPVSQYSIVVNDPEFTTYFAQTVLQGKLWAQIQAYLIAVGLPTGLVVAD